MSDVKVLTPDLLADVDSAPRVEPVDVPEWGGRVHVRGLTALEREQMDEVIYDADGNLRKELVRPALVAAALCHPDGSPFYAPGDARAVHVIGKKSPGAVRRVYDAAAKLNRLRGEDAAAGKDDSAAAPAAA